MLNFLAMALLGVLLVFGSMAFVHYYTNHDTEIEVPDVSGTAESVAVKKLEAMGFVVEVSDTGYVYRAAPGTILEQSIRAGKMVKPGRKIYLTINADGPRRIALPDIADNCSRRQAEDKLRTLGFKLGTTEYVIGDPEWVLAVKVNGKTVSAGTRISVNSPVTLVVGSGGLEDEYNGNDSLDYVLNAPDDESENFGDDAADTEITTSADSAAGFESL